MKFIFRLFFYIFNRNYRNIVKAKLAGANSKIKSGEEIVAILDTPKGRQVIR